MPEVQGPLITTLLLAAGDSSRLGCAKQLVNYRGESLVRKAARTALKVSQEVFVVTGYQAEMVDAELQGIPVQCIVNPDWKSGMGASIAAGARAAGEQPDGILILLCDQWKLSVSDLNKLVTAWKIQSGTACTATWSEASGPPAIFPRRLFGKLRNLEGDEGARSLLIAEQDVIRVPILNAQYDLDTPHDLDLLRARGADQS